jgi:hypothetical protein
MTRALSPRPDRIRTGRIDHRSGNVIDFPHLPPLLWVINLGCVDLTQSIYSDRPRLLGVLKTIGRRAPLPVDADVARAYGRVYAAVAAAGRKARGRRAAHLFIAATALAANLPLYTRTPADFAGLSEILDIVAI